MSLITRERAIRNLRTGGPCAIKVLHREAAAEAEIYQRFQAEARIVSALRHPNIVQVMDFDKDEDGSPFSNIPAAATSTPQPGTSGAVRVFNAAAARSRSSTTTPAASSRLWPVARERSWTRRINDYAAKARTAQEMGMTFAEESEDSGASTPGENSPILMVLIAAGKKPDA